jgi:hypothetical protein
MTVMELYGLTIRVQVDMLCEYTQHMAIILKYSFLSSIAE